MIENLPLHITVLFLLTTAFAVYMFYRSTGNSKPVLLTVLAWLLLQAVITFSGFYHYETGMPPRFALLVTPPLITIFILFILPSGRKFIDGMNLFHLTYLQTFRLPVEIVLYWLHLAAYIPLIMTFDGKNWDIITGITAPVIGYLYFARGNLGKATLIAWNIAGLLLLFNIVFYAVMSAPTLFQRFAFDMPNTAVFYFPFSWLPGFLVPLALLSHLASLKHLLSEKSHSSQM